MKNRKKPVHPYVTQAIDNQDLLASELSFPATLTEALSAEAYADYLSLMGETFSERKRSAETLILTRCNTEVLLGLQAALKNSFKPFFTTLDLQLSLPLATDFMEPFKNVLEGLSNAGLSQINLKGETAGLDAATLKGLIHFIKEKKLTVEIELPEGFAKEQQELDEAVSIHQREKRLADFGKALSAAEAEYNPKLPKIARNIAKQKTVSADVEEQVEVAVEASVENAVEEQFDEPAPLEMIDREEFVRRAKAKEMKVDDSIYEKLQGHEKRTWDHWMGNVSQWVVAPKKIETKAYGDRDTVCDISVMPTVPTESSNFSVVKNNKILLVLVQPVPGQKPSQIYSVHRYDNGQVLVFNQTPYSIYTGLNQFIQSLYPDNNYVNHLNISKTGLVNKMTSDEGRQFVNGLLPDTEYAECTKLVDDPKERWKGKKVYDATTLSEDDSIKDTLRADNAKKFPSGEVLPALYENPRIQGMTAVACEHLLKHQSQFQYGLDFQNLSAGFELLEMTVKGETKTVLDFHPRRAKAQSRGPLAIQYYQAPEAKPFSQTLFLQWQSQRSKSAGERLVQGAYETLLRQGYSRAQMTSFKRYFPVLILLPEETLTKAGQNLEALIKAAKDYQKIWGSKAAKIDSHLLGKLLVGKAEILKGLKSWQSTLGGFSEADLNGLLSLYDAYGEKGLSALFASWQETKPAILKLLKDCYYPHLQDFTQLLSKRHQEALNILDYLTDEEFAWFKSLYEQHSAAVGADDPFTLVNAFHKGFLSKIKEKVIDEKRGARLSLYAPCHFQGVKSLPATLSRILTIVNNTPMEDLPGVWSSITELDFQSNAAIRVVTDATSGAGGGQLLLPEMMAKPEHYYPEHGRIEKRYNWSTQNENKKDELPTHGYHAIQITRKNPNKKDGFKDVLVGGVRDYVSNMHHLLGLSKTQAELDRNYYRYIASKESRLPLDFYQKAAKLIHSKISSLWGSFDTQRFFYALVAASTTGFETTMRLDSPEKTLEQISGLLDFFNGLHIPLLFKPFEGLFRESMLESIFLSHMNPIPPVPMLKKMMEMAKKGFTVGGEEIANLQGLKKRFETYQKFFDNISYVSEKHRFAFYEGINFVSMEAVTQAKMLAYGDLAKAIYDCSDLGRGYGVQREKMQGALISLMSTFQLSYNAALKSIDEALKNSLIVTTERQEEALATALLLLTKMKSNLSALGTALTEQDLKDFIAKVKSAESDRKYKKKEDLDEHIIDLVRDSFGHCFEAGFFDNLKSAPLDNEEEKLIRESFLNSQACQKLAQGLLLSFKNVNDKGHRIMTIKSLAKLVDKQKMKEAEQVQFLTELGRINGKGDNYLEDLNKLLAAIGDNGSVQPFRFMLDCAKSEPTPALISKMILFYQVGVPYISENKQQILTRLELQPLIARLTLSGGQDADRFKVFFTSALGLVNNIAKECPNEKGVLLNLLDKYISEFREKTPKADFNEKFEDFLIDLQALVTFHDADLLRSLVDHYADAALYFHELLKEMLDLGPEDSYTVLSLLSKLLNNERDCNADLVKEFLKIVKADRAFLKTAGGFFACPPYPSLAQMLKWYQGDFQAQAAAPDAGAILNPKQDPSKPSMEKIKEAYQAFNLKPCKRESANGFKLEDAEKFAPLFEGMHFDAWELKELDKQTKDVQGTEASVLKAELQDFAALNSLSEKERALRSARLLAILAELLYRAKGSDDGKGGSFEINTVQYLAIYAFLKSKGHITSQIATGEGKSRIMMLSVACEYALGKTVDFVTSDMQLAQRDYLEFQAFFKLLDAPTSLVSATSPLKAYKMGGINFSDASNLSLFRNKAKSTGHGKEVMDEREEKRALLLDEADRTLYDVSETRFNYSQEANDNIKNMEWIYTYLVRFFNNKDLKQRELALELFKKDVEGCTRAFTKFIQAQADYSDDMLERIQQLSKSQLNAWQEAAITALDLRLGVDYALETNILIDTAKGPRMASEARLIYGNRIARNSKFSFGVHQCLHAHLNEELLNPESAISKKCEEISPLDPLTQKRAATERFFLHPEKQIVYSTTSKTFLDDYRKGDIWAVTGTAGAEIEREEARVLYGKETATEEGAMDFVNVPRRNGLNRKDDLLYITGGFKEKVQVLREYIIESRKMGRPVLLICENDREAELIKKALEKAFAKRPISEQITKTLTLPDGQVVKKPFHKDIWQYVDSTTSSAEEDRMIARAGIGGEEPTVTIATSRLGRGTDIKVKADINALGGLRVLTSYFARERDLGQIFGRTGRYGAKGDARMVVDRKQLRRQLGGSIGTDFYLSNEFYVKSQRTRIDREKQVERLLANALSDFRLRITDNFFAYHDRLPEAERPEKIKLWSDFTKRIDQVWISSQPDFSYELSKKVVNMHKLKRRMAAFRAAAQKEWAALRKDLKDNSLPERLSKFEMDPRTEHLMRLMLPKRKYTMADKTRVYKAYEKCLDGRATVYSNLFMEWKMILSGKRKLFANTRAWLAGCGILFANTRAWLAGKRPLFANFRAWLKRNAVKKAVAPLASGDILESLQKGDKAGVEHHVRTLDATQFVGAKRSDYMLSFKIQVVEAVLEFAHKKLRNGSSVSKKDMKEMQELLLIAKGDYKQQADLETALNTGLKHTRFRFFSSSIRSGVKQVMEERKRESELDLKALQKQEPGWEDETPSAPGGPTASAA